MNYEFIAQKVGEIIGEKAEYVKVPKGKHFLNGIIVGDGSIRPTIYTDDFERCFETEDEIALAISEQYKKTPKLEMGVELDLSVFDFENLKEKIFPCIVNKGAFIEKSVITRAFIGDIEICYRVFLNIWNYDGISSFLVKNEMLKNWNISADDLHKLAIENLCKKEYYFEDMIKTMFEISNYNEEEKDIIIECNSGNMFILSNDIKLYGASNMLNMRALSEIQEKIGDFFILPSSIHELILLPFNEADDVSEFSRMVREVNDTQVSEEERLSYSVFCYKAESGLLQVA